MWFLRWASGRAVDSPVVQSSSSLLEPLGSKLNRRNRRKFEQKAAKETKTDCGLGFCDSSSARAFGDCPVLQSSSSSLETLRSKLNRRNRRKFEQKAAKETKTDCGRVSVMVIRQG